MGETFASHEDSDDGVEPQPKIHIPPRKITKDTPRAPELDFFCRKPHVGLEEWNDALQMWEGLFRSDEIDRLPTKILRRTIKQALRDVEKFKDDDRFDQQVLLRWEQEFLHRMNLLQPVSDNRVFILVFVFVDLIVN
jgi:hypothetical protein